MDYTENFGIIELPDVRCFSCGGNVASKYSVYRELVKLGCTIKQALDALGVNRICCRIRFMTPNIVPVNHVEEAVLPVLLDDDQVDIALYNVIQNDNLLLLEQELQSYNNRQVTRSTSESGKLGSSVKLGSSDNEDILLPTISRRNEPPKISRNEPPPVVSGRRNEPPKISRNEPPPVVSGRRNEPSLFASGRRRSRPPVLIKTEEDILRETVLVDIGEGAKVAKQMGVFHLSDTPTEND